MRLSPHRLHTKSSAKSSAHSSSVSSSSHKSVRKKTLHSPRILHPKDVLRELSFLPALNHEELWLLVVENDHQLKRKILLSTGEKSRVLCCPRHILKEVILAESIGFLLVHNHPSGNELPSRQDLVFTHLIQKMAYTLGLCMLDHVIVSRERLFSFLKADLLSYKRKSKLAG